MDKPQTRPTVLIIDDEEQVRKLLTAVLDSEYECSSVNSAERALEVLGSSEFNLVISDINMEGISGLELVPRIQRLAPDTVVVMISGQQSIEYAIEAMHVGAYDYITKPMDVRHVKAAVDRALTHHKLLAKKREYETHLEDLVKTRTAEVQRLAYYDSLTDLPNRVLLTDRIGQALKAANHNQQGAGLLLISLDRFKKINDTLGHATGDQLLKGVAERLSAGVRETDVLGRFGGDEFALLLHPIDQSREVAEQAQAVLDLLMPSFTAGGQELYVNASVGISVFPADGDDTGAIMKNAGAALQRAKRKGGNTYEFYANEMNAEAVRRLALETDLRRAIANREFVTYYQPVINLATGKVVALEALVRWHHPDLGVLAPSEFVDIAEDTGLMLDIADQVLSEAAMQGRGWQENGFRELRIAVNISARQFHDKNFLDRIVHILGLARLDPQSVELEITETSLMENAGLAMNTLGKIRKMGVRISIDDFGTGYSSLSYLKRLPIDTVKLDRSFVTGATSDPKDAALVMAVITLAHNLNLKVIAEGIETEEQRDFLRLLRCDEGQGFLFGKPMPAAAFESTIAVDPQRKPNIVVASTPKTLRIARAK